MVFWMWNGMLLGLDEFLGTSGGGLNPWFGLKQAGIWNMNFALFFEFCEFGTLVF